MLTSCVCVRKCVCVSKLCVDKLCVEYVVCGQVVCRVSCAWTRCV